MDWKMDWTGKTAIITGAASGMGLLCSQCYAADNGNVVMVDINGEAVQKCADEINAKGKGRAIGVQCDVRDYAQVCAVRDRAVAEFGSIDLLVPFAGGAAYRVCKVPAGTEFPDVPIEVYDWGIDVNLKAQLYFDHAVMKQMRAQKSGVIIHIGSVTGAEGCPNSVDYATAKSGAMIGLTQSVALYGAQYGVRCCCVSPGPVLTRAAMARMKTAMGRAADPQEIVDSILFLASDHSSFTTGVNLLIDGGRLITRDRT